jgi:transposase
VTDVTGSTPAREVKMALFGFKTRHPERDRRTDEARFQHLKATLEGLLAEIKAEANGLEARYRNAADNAAFSLEVYENEGAEPLSAKAGDLTRAALNCSKRLGILDRHADFLRDLEEKTSLLLAEMQQDSADRALS